MAVESEIILWLFVINLGIAFGAGVYEARIVLPKWENEPPKTWEDTGKQFWFYATSIPLTVLTLASIPLIWYSSGVVGPWWLFAVVLTLIERIATHTYFIPTVRWMGKKKNESKIHVTLIRWKALNIVRLIVILSAWLAALKALSLL